MGTVKEPRRKFRLRFRFFALQAAIIEMLRVQMAPGALQISAVKPSGVQSAECPIDDPESCAVIANFVKLHRLSPADYGVYASLVTEYDHDGVRLPMYVVDLVRDIGGQVDFAFISTP